MCQVSRVVPVALGFVGYFLCLVIRQHVAQRKFQPSDVTANSAPTERALASIRYIRRAVDVLEEYINKHGAPVWAADQLARAAATAGTAVSYVSQFRPTKEKK